MVDRLQPGSNVPRPRAGFSTTRFERLMPDAAMSYRVIEIDGDSATAEAAFTGSFLDGQSVDLALVEEGDQWKLDELVGFAEFDREVFLDRFGAGLAEDPEVGAQADCVIGNLERLSEQQNCRRRRALDGARRLHPRARRVALRRVATAPRDASAS